MAKSASIILVATGIRVGNVFLNTHDEIDFKAGIAGLGAALVLSGLETIEPTFAIGLAYITLITSMFIDVHGIRGTTPAETVLRLFPPPNRSPHH